MPEKSTPPGLGYGSPEIVAIVQTMVKAHFYKSMTSNYNNTVWQDVYHVPYPDGTLYVKFTDNGGPAPIVQGEVS